MHKLNKSMGYAWSDANLNSPASCCFIFDEKLQLKLYINPDNSEIGYLQNVPQIFFGEVELSNGQFSYFTAFESSHYVCKNSGSAIRRVFIDIIPNWIILGVAVREISKYKTREFRIAFHGLAKWSNIFLSEFDWELEANPILKLLNKKEKETSILLFKNQDVEIEFGIGYHYQYLEKSRRHFSIRYDPNFAIKFNKRKNFEEILQYNNDLIALFTCLFFSKIELSDFYLIKPFYKGKQLKGSHELINTDIISNQLNSKDDNNINYIGLEYEIFQKYSQNIFENWLKLSADIKGVIDVLSFEKTKAKVYYEESFTSLCACIETIEGRSTFIKTRYSELRKQNSEKKSRSGLSSFGWKLKALLTPQLLEVLKNSQDGIEINNEVGKISEYRDYLHHRHQTPEYYDSKDFFKYTQLLKGVILYYIYIELGIPENETIKAIKKLPFYLNF